MSAPPRLSIALLAVLLQGCAVVTGPCDWALVKDPPTSTVTCGEGGRLIAWRPHKMIEALGKLRTSPPPADAVIPPAPEPPASDPVKE